MSIHFVIGMVELLLLLLPKVILLPGVSYFLVSIPSTTLKMEGGN